MAKIKKATTCKLTILPEEKHPFPIPQNWFWTDIDSINFYSGSQIDPTKQPDTVFELYSVPSSANDYPEIITGSEIGSAKQSVLKNDVLLCKINPRINRVWKVSQHTDYELLASSEWIIIRNAAMNPTYLMYCLTTQYFRKFMLSNVSGVGGSLMRAQPKYVRNYPIPIAPLAEQHRIVGRIESLFAKLDEAKEKAQAVVDGFEMRKAAILHKAFTGELTEQWRKKHKVGIESWKYHKYAELGTAKLGKMLDKSKNTGQETKYLRNINVRWFEFDLSDLASMLASDEERRILSVEEGDLFICEGGEPGRCAVWKDHRCDLIFQKALHRFRPNLRAINDFLCYNLYYMSLNGSLEQHFTGSTIKHLTGQSLAKIELLLPCREEQLEIVLILDSLLEQERQAKDAAEAVLDQIDTMKKSILARAFRGELGTNDPTEESAVELLNTLL